MHHLLQPSDLARGNKLLRPHVKATSICPRKKPSPHLERPASDKDSPGQAEISKFYSHVLATKALNNRVHGSAVLGSLMPTLAPLPPNCWDHSQSVRTFAVAKECPAIGAAAATFAAQVYTALRAQTSPCSVCCLLILLLLLEQLLQLLLLLCMH